MWSNIDSESDERKGYKQVLNMFIVLEFKSPKSWDADADALFVPNSTYGVSLYDIVTNTIKDMEEKSNEAAALRMLKKEDIKERKRSEQQSKRKMEDQIKAIVKQRKLENKVAENAHAAKRPATQSATEHKSRSMDVEDDPQHSMDTMDVIDDDDFMTMLTTKNAEAASKSDVDQMRLELEAKAPLNVVLNTSKRKASVAEPASTVTPPSKKNRFQKQEEDRIRAEQTAAQQLQQDHIARQDQYVDELPDDFLDKLVNVVQKSTFEKRH